MRDRGVLVRLDGDASGEVISLPREPVIVGRSSRAHVHIAEPSVSREHARIVFEYGAYYAVDGGSQNGTMVAGRKIMRAELRDGDLVQFGQRSTYRFSLMDQTQEQVMRRLYESSTRDPLTGADNRRNMESRLQSEIAFAERHKRPLSVILLDIDFFKSVNDRYGHPAGDEVLKSVTGVVRGQLRTEDAFARYGGEEFVIVLRDTTLAQAALVAERVRDKIGKTSVEVGGPTGVTITVTVSAGLRIARLFRRRVDRGARRRRRPQALPGEARRPEPRDRQRRERTGTALEPLVASGGRKIGAVAPIVTS